MTFNKIYCILIAGLCTLSVYGQTDRHPGIEKRLDVFIDLTNQKKYSEAFDLMYPKMFDQVSKQELVDLMTSMDQDGLSLQIMNKEILSFSAPLQDGEETFVRMDYNADVVMDIKSGGMFDYPEANSAMLQQFKSAYGEANVTWMPEKKRFEVLMEKSMIAVQKGGGDWYLVEINPDQMELMKYLFPEAVMNTLVNIE